MSTVETAYSNTTTDLIAVVPDIEAYDQKKLITNWETHSGNVYRSPSSGYISILYQNGRELGSAQASLGDVDATDEWFYDSGADVVYAFNSSNSPNEERMEAGVDWETLKTRVNNEMAERIRSFVPFPIVSRKGVGTASASSRDYDWIIIKSNATLTCSSLVRPLNQELADELEKRIIDPETENGLLDQLVAGKYRLWNQGERQKQLRVISANASTTGDIVDVRGKPTVEWDLIQIKINTTGTFTAGSASGVKFDSYIGDGTSLKISQVASAEVIDGSFQNVGHGMYVRFSPGVYNSTSDEWELEVSGMQDNPMVKTARLWR
tara:strand:+ start:757 stop:1722 length:966 start_codon:yes stop_codon:yes gene_type:complete